VAIFSTETEAQQYLDKLKEAYFACMSGKSYTINTGGTSRSLTRNNLKELREEMTFVEQEILAFRNGRSVNVKYITPSRGFTL
jgi:uncharacterized protein with PIN domain